MQGIAPTSRPKEQPELLFGERWPCYLEVDLDAIAHNVRAVQAAAQPSQGVTAVVKADAYGLGAVPVARAALEAGARGLAVARVAEATRLRDAGIAAPILLMSAFAPGEIGTVLDLGLVPTVTDRATLDRVAHVASERGVQAAVQVKVDTGMTRFGAPPEEAVALVRSLVHVPSVRLDGFYTHFAAADDPDPFFAHQQLARFRAICHQLEMEGFKLGLRHAANSAGALRVPGCGLDTVRAGVALSGACSSSWVPKTGELRSAVSLKARVVRLQTPAIGSSVGYGRTYKVYRPLRAALIALGYADGLPRACSNRGWVLIHGQRAPLIGTVSMDMAMVDVTHISDARPGDEVVALGRQGDQEITIAELADSAGLIPHELLVRLGGREEHVYMHSETPADPT